MTLRRIFAAALAAVLLGAVPRPIVFSAPAGNRPAGAPNASRPYDLIARDGRTVSPLGTNVTVDPGARSVALSPDGTFILVGGASLQVLDAHTLRVISTVPDARSPVLDVAAVRDPADPTHAIVAALSRFDGGELRFYDLGSDGTLTKRGGSVGTGGDPDAPSTMTISADGRIAYVVGGLSGALHSIEIASGRQLGEATAVGFSPAGIAVAGRRLYVTNAGVMEVTSLSTPVRIPEFGVAPYDSVRSSSLTALGLKDDGTVDAATAQTAKMDSAPDELTNIGGAQPTRIAVSKDGRYAFVCMSNVDRIAVVALSGVPRVVGGLSLRLFQSSSIGSAPYGTHPSAILRSADGNRLYVALDGIDAVAVLDSSKPVALRRLGLLPTGGDPSALALSADGRYLFVANAQGEVANATLQRVDLRRVPLQAVTLSALRYNRSVAYGKDRAVVPAMRLDEPVRSKTISHVVVVYVGYPAFSPSESAGDAPNIHALARAYSSAANFYADARSEPTSLTPNLYPRAGYVFNDAQRAGRSYRDYGGLIDLLGRVEDVAAPTSGLGGLYGLEVPALAALASHIDLDYPGPNDAIRDERRAREFVRDIAPLVQNDAMPDFTYVRLPGLDASQGDSALGTIVDYLTHSPQWSSTAIFIVPDSPRPVPDAAGWHPSFAIVVSPFAKHGYASHVHISTASVLKTEEELLGLPPVGLADLLATDMADFFTAKPDPTSYSAQAVGAAPIPEVLARPGVERIGH